jgi:hypothetical protein
MKYIKIFEDFNDHTDLKDFLRMFAYLVNTRFNMVFLRPDLYKWT